MPMRWLSAPTTCTYPTWPKFSRARASRLPMIAPFRPAAEMGALVAWGFDIRYAYRRAAAYADSILRSTRPADLPMEQPSRFELVINLEDREGPRPHDSAGDATACRRGDQMSQRSRAAGFWHPHRMAGDGRHCLFVKLSNRSPRPTGRSRRGSAVRHGREIGARGQERKVTLSPSNGRCKAQTGRFGTRRTGRPERKRRAVYDALLAGTTVLARETYSTSASQPDERREVEFSPTRINPG